MPIDPANPLPKYVQLRDAILDWITESGLGVDDMVPSERELSALYGLSRMTVRQSVDLLVTEGRLYRVPGKGTFVARPKIEMSLVLASFSEDMRARGYEPGARELIRRTIPASGHTARMLDIAPGTPVHHIERMRTADGEPMAVERSNIPAAEVPGLEGFDLSARSLYEVLEHEYDILLDSGEQTIEAGLCDSSDSRLLGLPAGSPVLVMQRRSFAKGRCVELALSTYRADRYQLHSRLDPRRHGD
ncbi:GntR family transcriptional regulator [Nocardiopsis sp. LOL_012]|uniref:GntR family transcriptional regulator n=1 Tax=Nocardiopsis sp. LOL_012 TaxID=3345409 RepID=UPI003A8B85FC